MRSVAEIFKTLEQRLGGLTAVATALGLPLTTVSSWKSRGAIPSKHWSPIAQLARKCQIPRLNVERLAAIAAADGDRGARAA